MIRRTRKEDDHYYDTKIKERIKEALSEQKSGETLDPATLEHWVAENRRKTNPNIYARWYAVVACVITICIATVVTVPLLNSDESTSIAGNDEEQSTEAGGDVIVDNVDGEGENPGQGVKKYPEERIGKAKEKYKDLMIPGYVPEGYKLDNLEITISDKASEYKFYYYKGSQLLEIIQVSGVDSSVIYNNVRTLQCLYGDVYIYETETEKNGTCKLDGQLLNIVGICSDEEYIEIFNNWK